MDEVGKGRVEDEVGRRVGVEDEVEVGVRVGWEDVGDEAAFQRRG
jgi:hypothetical protein